MIGRGSMDTATDGRNSKETSPPCAKAKGISLLEFWAALGMYVCMRVCVCICTYVYIYICMYISRYRCNLILSCTYTHNISCYIGPQGGY